MTEQHDQILQLLITGGFLDPGKLKEARDIIGKCAPSGSLEDRANKLYPNILNEGFPRYEQYLYAAAERRAERAAFLAGASHSFNKESFLKALREAAKYKGEIGFYGKGHEDGWNECVSKVAELLNQKEEK